MLILVLMLHFVYATNIFLDQNFGLTKCLKGVTKLILKSNGFDRITKTNFEQNLLYSVATKSNYASDFQKLYITVLKKNDISDYNLKFDSYGYDKNIVIIQEDFSELVAEKLLVKQWIEKRQKIGIIQIVNDDITLITNFNLENKRVCSAHFYQKYSNCCTNLTINNYYLSKKYRKRLCRLKVSWVRAYPFVGDIKERINPGLMISFFNIYQEKRSIKLLFQNDNSEYQHEFISNGTFFKLRRDLLEGKYDAAIGPLFMNKTSVVPFSYGPVFFKDRYYLTGQKRVRINNYQKLTIVFNSDVWKGFLITFVVVTLSYFLLNILMESHEFGLTSAVFDIFRLSLSCSVSMLPQSAPLRLLFIFYSLFSINIDSAYLGKLSSIFTNAPFDAQETSIWRMMTRGTTFNINWLAERLMKLRFVGQRTFITFMGMGHRLRNESDYDCLKRVAYSQQNITFTLLSTLTSHPYETSLVDYFDPGTTYLTLFVTFYVRNDLHLKESLQFWSNEVFEKGFITKWMKDIIEQNRNGSHIPTETKEAIALKFQHFEEIFELSFLGYLLAGITLVLELVYWRIDRRFGVTKKIKYLFDLLKLPPNN